MLELHSGLSGLEEEGEAFVLWEFFFELTDILLMVEVYASMFMIFILPALDRVFRNSDKICLYFTRQSTKK